MRSVSFIKLRETFITLRARTLVKRARYAYILRAQPAFKRPIPFKSRRIQMRIQLPRSPTTAA